MQAQMELFASEGKKQTFIDGVDPNDCVIDPFNSRKTRPPEHIEKLANRMLKYGYDKTRAVWARYDGAGTLSVFAGGTRLDAAKKAGISVAVILHDGYTDEEIAWLTELDNENDEYHIPVGPVDTWADYAWLRDEKGWTQQRIADAKGVGQSLVSKRLKLHSLSGDIKAFIHRGLLSESHLIEITQLFIDEYFSPWLTTEQAWGELAEWASVGQSVNQTKKKVGEWKSFVKLAEKAYACFRESVVLHDLSSEEPAPYDYNERAAFIDELVQRSAHTAVAVREAKGAVEIFVANRMKEYEIWVKEQTAAAAKVAIMAEKEREILSKYRLGDCLDLVDEVKDKSVRLLLVDPPYGKDFQSNRRIKSPKAPKLVNDTSEAAIELYRGMLGAYKPKMQDESHLLSFCDWQNEPLFRQALEEEGFVLRGSLIWVKENHSSGDLVCSFAPKHERILHATLGRPIVDPRIDDVLIFPRDLQSEHPTAKPTPLLEKLILSCTAEQDLVIDPTAGCASTLRAAMNVKRDFWGCEIDKRWHDVGCARLLEGLNDGI